jgi:AhpD family alkylhydroperoxidase
MARISLDPQPSLVYRLAAWYARRKYGVMLDPGRVLGHNPQVLRSYARYEMAVTRWRRVSPELKDLAVMAVAARIGCAWCLDFGAWVTRLHGTPPEKIRAVPHWRDSDLFDEAERLTLEYAEAMTATPPEVTDALVTRLRAHLDDAQLVELTELIAVENLRSRVNTAFGLTGQGFADRCELSA